MKINKVFSTIPTAVPNIIQILEKITSCIDSIHVVLDLANVLFCSPLQEGLQNQLASIGEGREQTFQILSQGYLHSLNTCHSLVDYDITLFLFSMGIAWFHYTDDVRLIGEDDALREGTTDHL